MTKAEKAAAIVEVVSGFLNHRPDIKSLEPQKLTSVFNDWVESRIKQLEMWKWRLTFGGSAPPFFDAELRILSRWEQQKTVPDVILRAVFRKDALARRLKGKGR